MHDGIGAVGRNHEEHQPTQHQSDFTDRAERASSYLRTFSISPRPFAFAIVGAEAIMKERAKRQIGAEEATVPLEITQREMGGIYLLALKGRLVLGEESSGFRSTVENLLSSGATRIVINLERVDYVDSAGLGALIEAHRKTKANGGRLKLSNLGPNFKQALELARLLPLFETCPTEAAAVAAF